MAALIPNRSLSAPVDASMQLSPPLDSQPEPAPPRPNLLRRVFWVTCGCAGLSMPFVAAWAVLRWSAPGAALGAMVAVSVPVALFACLITLARESRLPKGLGLGVGGVSLAVSLTLGLGVGLLWREPALHHWAIKTMVERAYLKELQRVFESPHTLALEEACLAVAGSKDPALQQLLLRMMGAHPPVARRCLALKLPPPPPHGLGRLGTSRMEVVLRRWWNEMYEAHSPRAAHRAQAIALLEPLSAHPYTMLLACSLTHPDPAQRTLCHTLLESKTQDPRELVLRVLERPEALAWAPEMRQAMVDASFLGRGLDGRTFKDAGIDPTLYTSSSLQVVALDLSCQVFGERGLSQDAELAVARGVKTLCALNLPAAHTRPKEIWQAVCRAPLLENKLHQTLCPISQITSASQLIEHAIATASNLAIAGSKQPASAAFAQSVALADDILAGQGYDIQSLKTTGEFYEESAQALEQLQGKSRSEKFMDLLKEEGEKPIDPSDRLSPQEIRDLFQNAQEQ